jgi:hypothetical protein
MYIVAAILISETCLLYQNYGFGIIIINGTSETQNSRNTVHEINLRNWGKTYL